MTKSFMTSVIINSADGAPAVRKTGRDAPKSSDLRDLEANQWKKSIDPGPSIDMQIDEACEWIEKHPGLAEPNKSQHVSIRVMVGVLCPSEAATCTAQFSNEILLRLAQTGATLEVT